MFARCLPSTSCAAGLRLLTPSIRTLSTTAYRPAQPSTVPLAEFAPSRPSSSRPSLDFTVAGAGSPAVVKAGQKIQAGPALVGKSSKVFAVSEQLSRATRWKGLGPLYGKGSGPLYGTE